MPIQGARPNSLTSYAIAVPCYRPTAKYLQYECHLPQEELRFVDRDHSNVAVLLPH
ncbi:Uncharacterised protein [Vibrio cholerae]|nr:Uncharacterised protein [Vibrio cholerae]